ncbi:MAG: Hsp20/alpha crystallin family protein [Chloroflexi bacterium]|nr:Hsp20/alpha crystallin family protein [Chloroflexota bacterium]MBV9596468.1 Hsp20/alpha crystallin family protein [Chloroflexota bacterium]
MAIDDQWQREMQRYLAHFNRAGKRPTIVFSQHAQPSPVWTPAMDVYETARALVVLLDLAGVDAARTEIRAEPHLLVIRGVRREPHVQEKPDERRSYLALEIPYGHFERSVRLPPGLDTSAAHASYRDGLLEIALPKRTARQVPISVEDAAHAS